MQLNSLVSGIRLNIYFTATKLLLYLPLWANLYIIGYMNSIQTTLVFDDWFASLRDLKAKFRIQARIDLAEDGNFGDCAPIGEGVSEMRIHVGAGYRVYFKKSGTAIYVVLAGGNKSTQKRDIKLALEIANEIKVKK